MRILIYGLNFAPELTGIGKYTGEMAAWLADRGHEIKVVTAPPYYPQWQVQSGYSSLKYRSESIDGVWVCRCPLWVPHRPSGLKRLLHLKSFAVTSLLPLLWLALRRRPDVILMVEPTGFCIPGAWLAARIGGAALWLHVQDFELDAAFDLGILRGRPLRRGLLALERFWMRRFDRVSTISERMLERLAGKAVPPDRRILFPNWVDTQAIKPMAEVSALRPELGIPDATVVALYAGNLGAKQGLEILVQAAQRLLGRKDLLFVICGEGGERQTLQTQAQGLGNMRFLPLQPLPRLNTLLNLADIHLLPQRQDAEDLVMPSKLTGMLASGKPVIATTQPDSQVGKVVSGCGILTRPGDAAEFAAAILRLADSPQERQVLGARARRFAETHLDKERILGSLETQLLACARR